MDERANQYFDDIIENSDQDNDDDASLSIDELLEVKQIPHQDGSYIDSADYMAPAATPDETTMLVRLAPFASKDNAVKSTEQPSVAKNTESTQHTMDNDPFIDPDEYTSEDTDAVENPEEGIEIGFSFDEKDTIPYEDDGIYIPLEVVTAYHNTGAPGSRIVDDTPVGSDQEVGSLNNNMARIVSATGLDVDQASEDMAKELALALSKKEADNSAEKEENGPDINLSDIFAKENAQMEAKKENKDDSLQCTEEVDGFASMQNLGVAAAAEEKKPSEGKEASPDNQNSLAPAIVSIATATPPATRSKEKKRRPQSAGAIEGSKAPNHFGPRTYDPKLEQKPFEYKFEKKKKKKKNLFKELLGYIITIALAYVCAKLITTYVLINAVIPTGSMIPTIEVNDRVMGFRLMYNFTEPKRYDVIVFPAPDEPDREFIKRIIGLPGETIEAVDGVVTITHVDGSTEVLNEPYLNEEWTVASTFGPYKIPEDSYFCMGDNRNSSKDARYWVNKYVKRSDIKGKALLRYWPFSHFGVLE